MRYSPVLLIPALLLVVATSAFSGSIDDRRGHGAVMRIAGPGSPPAPPATAKSAVDSVYVFGGPGTWEGKFEDAYGNKDWHGWTHLDPYAQDLYWHASEFQAINGQYSAWCGTYFDDDPGYGNLWNQILEFTWPAPDAQAATTVHWTALLRNDTEPIYDFTFFEVNVGGFWQVLRAVDGLEPLVTIDLTHEYQPGEYIDGNIVLRVRFNSDIAWSDEDDLIDTNGACQIDDIVVRLDGEVVSTTDFEDQTLGDWYGVELTVGDFAALWQHLQDLDPCFDDFSWQLAFVDDGLVVPGTGGSQGQTWRYGPGGYIVNNTGGLLGPGNFLENWAISPVIEWPAGYIGGELRLLNYLHEGGSWPYPGILWDRGVRSTADPINDPIAEQPIRWLPGVFLGPPVYWWPHYWYRWGDLSPYLVPGCEQIQIVLAMFDGDLLGPDGTDGTPAPYFDEISVVAYGHNGPVFISDSRSTANDGFPEIGDLDLNQPANNWIRFDAFFDTDNGPAVVPGDALLVTAKTTRLGAVMVENPRMHVAMRANPLFDDARQLPPGFVQTGALITGSVLGDTVRYWNGDPRPDLYSFDLPDSTFFYPGDIIHYLFEARDDLGGEIGTTIMPVDTSGFHDFAAFSSYDEKFTVRGLPTLHSLTPGDQPRILYWEDSFTNSNTGHRRLWLHAFQHLGYELGIGMDMYHTQWVENENSNGLGGRATSATLDGYDLIVHSSGWDYAGALQPEDIDLLENWFARGEKHALFTGARLATDLAGTGGDGLNFLNHYLGANYLGDDVGALMGHQLSPHIQPTAGAGVIARVDEWVINGGCPERITFDAVEPIGAATTIAEFLDPNGNPGGYPYAAGIRNIDWTTGADVIYFPYDFGGVLNAQGWEVPPEYEGIAARAIMLEDILTVFGQSTLNAPIGAPKPLDFAVQAAPNPFNPRTSIQLSLPRDGDVSVKIYSVRGELVRTLHDGRLAAGVHRLIWQGDHDSGRPVGSGVYFCETIAGRHTDVRRMTLVR